MRRTASARPPPGTLSLSELAREMGLSDELVTRIRLMADQEGLAKAADPLGIR